MNEIIPGILEKDWREIERKIETVKPFAKVIHIDVIDGKFAPQATLLDPEPFRKYTSELFFELHLMVEEPVNYLKSWSEAGFKRFYGHIEKMSDQVEFLAQGQILGEVGLAVDGHTSLDKIQVPLEDIDDLLIMMIRAGESGQKFMPEYLEKIRKIKEMEPNLKIEVDGGINDETIVLAKEAGACKFATTSFLFGSNNPLEKYNLLKEKIF